MDKIRRDVIKTAVSAIGMGLSPAPFAASNRVPRVESPIKHVFVLMLENRSFDHLLGFSGIPGIDGAKPPSVRGAADRLLADPSHELPDVCQQLTGKRDWDPAAAVTMGGFTGKDTFDCFDPACTPVLTTLAREFAVCSRWFSSMPGPTWPNRFFAHAGSSGGLDNSPSSFTSVTSVAFDELGFEFEHGCIFERLKSEQWCVYHGDAFPQVLAIEGVKKPWFWGNAHFRKLHHLLNHDLKPGRAFAPAYVFIEPDYGVTDKFGPGNSQHPVGSVAAGEDLLRSVYLALVHSDIWKESALIVTYDEHGGFYDHALPPPAVKPGDATKNHKRAEFRGTFDFSRLGVRVPAVVISPWTARQVVHCPLDHSCVLRTLDDLFGTGAFTERDRTAQSLAHLFAGPYRADAPTKLPEVVECGGRKPLRQNPYVPPPTTAEMLEREAQGNSISAFFTAGGDDRPGDGVLNGFVRIAAMVDGTMRRNVPTYQFEAEPRLRTASEARDYVWRVAQRLERHRVLRAGQPLL